MVTYKVITFAPVQGFIEKSRKLRDLYGSSFLLSYLSKVICDTATELGYEVISPAPTNVTQGTPNQIVVKGENEAFDRVVREKFNQAWKQIVDSIRTVIEENLPQFQPYCWKRDWNLWASHTWEFFLATGSSMDRARIALNEMKRPRNWTGINWVGESSSLSGGDAVAWYGMSDQVHPKKANMREIQQEIAAFYQELSQAFSNSIVDADEELSIPELIKRFITLEGISAKLRIEVADFPKIEIPHTFRDINRKRDNPEDYRWTGWFQGDGDKIGDYLKSLDGDKDANLNQFSKAMIDWGKGLASTLPLSRSEFGAESRKLDREGRIIYAGGDDFLGVLYRNELPKLTARECLNWFYQFPEVWQRHEQKITVSIGFVWAAPGVPQRDVLQNCRETESLAKKNGRDRLAVRILFNSGNHLDWHCPWKFLDIFEKYCDRDRVTGERANWNHIYNDVATLETRHAFPDNTAIALSLFEAYFGQEQRFKLEDETFLWNNREQKPIHTGILGEAERYTTQTEKDNALVNWIINLAKVGFYLCQ